MSVKANGTLRMQTFLTPFECGTKECQDWGWESLERNRDNEIGPIHMNSMLTSQKLTLHITLYTAQFALKLLLFLFFPSFTLLCHASMNLWIRMWNIYRGKTSLAVSGYNFLQTSLTPSLFWAKSNVQAGLMHGNIQARDKCSLHGASLYFFAVHSNHSVFANKLISMDLSCCTMQANIKTIF